MDEFTDEYFEKLNRNSEKRTQMFLEKLKKCKGYENLTDEEAREVLNDLESLCRIIISVMKRQGQI